MAFSGRAPETIRDGARGSEQGNRTQFLALVGLAVLSELAYLAVVRSAQSLHETNTGEHSLLLVLALFGIAFGCYLGAIRIAGCLDQTRWLSVVLVGAGITFRATLLFSDPIEEIDIYRYLWDGTAITNGVSPFRYSPHQVLAATAEDELPPHLARLVLARESSPVMQTILNRVHFGQLPTIYPPISQLIFALSALTAPADSSLFWRIVLIKVWFIGFDLATWFLVVRLLRLANRPVGLSVAYGWCPLLMKEIANSGHLDALAVFLATLAIYLGALVLFRSPSQSALRWGAAGSAVALALAVGAKLYPVVLAPLIIVSFGRRFGLWIAMEACLAFAVVATVALVPMMPVGVIADPSAPAPAALPAEDSPPLPPEQLDTRARDPSQSLKAFLSEWEMNDFLFLLVMENLRPTAGLPASDVAWFSFVPEQCRGTLADRIQATFGMDVRKAPFFLSRVLTSLVFLAICAWFAWVGAKVSQPTDWFRAAFLTVAWFWLLLPTLNPWYWTWALPLLPFARSRAWLALSGLVLMYYLRFWFAFCFPDTPLLGTRYSGPMFFDYVVTWIEFGPWFIWLALDAGRQRRPRSLRTVVE